jgi:general secretion pathway protein C
MGITNRGKKGAWPMRALVVLVSAGLVAITLWNFRWDEEIRSYVTRAPPPEIPPQVASPRAVAPTTEAAAKKAILGTDASISPVPAPLILVHTMPGRNAREGSAQLGTNRENPQTYVAGALLLNGAELAEIHQDYVVLQRGKQSVRLYVSKEGSPSGDANSSALLYEGGTANVPPPRVTSVETVTNYVRPTPVFEGALIRGYQVFPGERAAVFSQLGLQSGDVVTTLDGLVLNDAQNMVQAFRELASGSRMAATVIRAGQTLDVSLDGSLILADQQHETP